jgi:hypothetical protein
MAAKMTEPNLNVKPSHSALDAAIVVACTLLWIGKFWLVPRININWDEFYFLTHVHAAARGDLTLGLQTAFAHLFTWLPRVPGTEADEVVAGRVAMTILLGLSAWLVHALAARRCDRTDALTAALAFLALWPTLRHGASFRADSLLLPLQLAALVVITRPGGHSRRRAIAAGLLLGVAATVTIKSALVAPVVLALGWLGARERETTTTAALRAWLVEAAWIAGTAAASAGLLLGVHLLTLDAAAVATAPVQASTAWSKTIVQPTLLPRLDVLTAMFNADPGIWSLGIFGAVVAISRRQWHALACALALLPVLFYRNSFPYFYVVMCAPAAVLIATGTRQVRELARSIGSDRAAGWTRWAIAGVIAIQAAAHMSVLAEPRQARQRAVIAAVHQIFPHPVPYIDHSGMMASFPKVNFFMSTWGMEQYRASGRGFMREAVEKHRAPLLIANRAVLQIGSSSYRRLLAEDRELIECCFVPVWGPVSIAGTRAVLDGDRSQVLRLPFGGAYRLDAPVPVLIDGVVRSPSAVVHVDDPRRGVSVQGVPGTTGPVSIRLLWAEAAGPPRAPPPARRLYDPL